MMTETGITVRRLTSLDSGMLARLEQIGQDALGDSALDHWMLPVVARCGMLFVAELGTEPVGAAEVLRCGGEGDVYLEGLYISTAQQGRGYGASLLSAVIEMLSREKFHRLLGTVAPGNTAGRRLYARVGFRETGNFPDYYGPGRHRLGIELMLGRA